MSSPKPSNTAINLLVLLGTSCVAFVLGEFILRLRYAEPVRSPSPEILAIQPHLALDNDIGFTWNKNVSADEGIIFNVADAEFEPLSTDSLGFMNHPEAIASRNADQTIDIVGLGDSFIEHAAHSFYEYFKRQGLSYYSMAVHRQSPPQYTMILDKHAMALRPRWILYGLFENDFIETSDFDEWQISNLDWFTYHSGTWCGLPVSTNPLQRFVDSNLRGYAGVSHIIRTRIRGDRMSITGPSDWEIQRVLDEIGIAAHLTVNTGTQLALVLIPSRVTATTEPTSESKAFDTVLSKLNSANLHPIDLRPAFREHPDPSSLFYAIDGHWNSTGIQFAAAHIAEVILSSP